MFQQDSINNKYLTQPQRHRENKSISSMFQVQLPCNNGNIQNDSFSDTSFIKGMINDTESRRNECDVSKDTLLNIQLNDEYQLFEIKLKLDEELIKNENLELKIRSLEYDNLKLQNKMNRKVQELEHKNINLSSLLKEMEAQVAKSQDNQSYISEKEDKDVENKLFGQIIHLKERETEFINQINKLRAENFDLRLKTQKYTLLTTKEDNLRKSQLPNQRRSSAFMCSPMPVCGRNSAQRLSMISFEQRMTSGFQLQNLNLDYMNDALELKQVIVQLAQDKELLGQEIQNIKDKAINQIIAKEKQIIELMKFQESEMDNIKQENSRLLLELQSSQKIDREKVSIDKNLQVKFERDIKELKKEVALSEDKYTKLHQKYLEDRRHQDKEIAFLHDKYLKDTQFYEAKLDKQKERSRHIMEENEKLKGKIMQTQDFRQEIIRDLEEHEQRLRESEKEKHLLEKDFLSRLESKNQMIKEKQMMIQEVQDQLFNFESNLKEALAKAEVKHEKELNEIKDEIATNLRERQEIEIELFNVKSHFQKQQELNKELQQKKTILNQIISEQEEQKKVIEANYNEKIEVLENQLEQNLRLHQQQISSIRMQYELLENGDNQLNSLKEVDECLETEGDCQQNQYVTSSTQMTSTPTKKVSQKLFNFPVIQTTLMDELGDDNYSRFSINSNNFNLKEQRYSQFSNKMYGLQTPFQQSPRCSNNSYLMQIDQQRLSPTVQRSPMNYFSPVRGTQFKLDLQKQKYDDSQELREEIEQLKLQLNEKEEEIQEFDEQMQIYEEQIKALEQSKEDMTSEFKLTLLEFQKQTKNAFEQLQSVRKQKLADQQTMHKQLLSIQTQLTSEIQSLRRKLRTSEQENEDLLEQMISQKQQYSQEVNHLKIQLTESHDKSIQIRLKEAHLVMEKDLVAAKIQDYKQQVGILKSELEKTKELKLACQKTETLSAMKSREKRERPPGFKNLEEKIKHGFDNEKMSGNNQNYEQNSVIPATQRADGSWRKEIKVRPGYTPLEEKKLYVAPFKRKRNNSGIDSDLSDDDFKQFTNQQDYSEKPAKVISKNNMQNEEEKYSTGATKVKPTGNMLKQQSKYKVASSKHEEEKQVINDLNGFQLTAQDEIKRKIKIEKDLKKLGKKLKQIEKLETLGRELNEDEKLKVQQKDDLLQKMESLRIQ